MSGGNAGKVAYPAYIQTFHGNILGDGTTTAAVKDIDGHIADLLTGTNPYAGVTAHDPDADITTIQTRTTVFADVVDGIDEQGTWSAMIDEVTSRLDDILPSLSDIDTEVTEFEAQSRNNLAQSYNRITAGLFDINAVISTAFPSALAVVEDGFATDVSRFRAERQQQVQRERTLIIQQSVNSMINLLNLRVTGTAGSVTAQDGTSKTRIAALADQINQDLAYDVDEAYWKLDAVLKGGSGIGLISGLAAGQKGPTKIQSILGGAAIGAGIGIQAGIATGSLGIGVATALIGSILGGVSGGSGFA